MDKASGGDGISVELFQILKDYAVKVLHLICQQIWKFLPTVATGLEKVSFHSNPKERQCQRMFKLPHNCSHLTCQQGNAQNPSSQASTIHEPRSFRRSSWVQQRQRNQRSNCQHPLDHKNIKRVPEKHLLLLHFDYTFSSLLHFFYFDYTKAFGYVGYNNGKFFKRWEYQTTLPASRETCMQVKKQQLKLDMGQQTGSKPGKEYVKAVYCHPAYLTYMQSTS